MLVTTEKVKSFNPCKDRFDNFKKQYPNYSGELRDFLNLKNITYSDKVWVFTRTLDKDTLVRWSIKCAETVKHIYDNETKDGKLNEVFELLKSIKDFNNMGDEDIEKAESAESAAESAESAAARSAARSAKLVAWAARSVAETAKSEESAWSAADAVARLVAESEKAQEQKNLDLLVEVLDEKNM